MSLRQSFLIQLEAEARKPLANELVEDLLVLVGGFPVQGSRIAVAILEQRLPGGVDEIDVVAVELFGLVSRRRVVGVERSAAIIQPERYK